MAKRGFFAELQRQGKIAQRQQQQAASQAYRAQMAAARASEQAQKQAERAQLASAKATVAAQKAAEREAQRMHEEAMLAQAAAQNAELASTYGEIDSLLAATLATDDFVDLETFRQTAEHPPFARPDLLQALPLPSPLVTRPEPQYVEPDAPRGLSGLFGGKKKHADLVAKAQAVFAEDHAAWQGEVARLPDAQARQEKEYEQAEQHRQAMLQEAQVQYDAECKQRELEAQEENRKLDTLIQGLAYGVEDAIQEYVSIVLGNSAYPESFPVEHDFTFDSSLKELVLTVLVPSPQSIPTVREYKFVRAKDEVVPTDLPMKDQKDRYTGAIAQVALRSLHEVFESDRSGRIATITLTVACEAIHAATGRPTRTPLVAVATDRDAFMTFDLSNVIPLATLQHLGALVSKSPFDMVAIDTSKGVRGR